MKIVALLTFRNEELYLKRCIEHLIVQGIDICAIDNGSTDSSVEIAKSFLNKGVIRLEYLPFKGYYDWHECLKHKEKLASEINADWFIHHDADEIRQSPNPFKSLKECIKEVDRIGYNAINFDEFVFIPWKEDNGSIKAKYDYVKEMKYYYYFKKGDLRRVNAWKNLGIPINLTSKGGHRVLFPGQKIYPQNFILRHYIALSEEHLVNKYSKRVYSSKEVEKFGWHKFRAYFSPNKVKIPSKKILKTYKYNNIWDKSNPLKYHAFIKRRYQDKYFIKVLSIKKRFIKTQTK